MTRATEAYRDSEDVLGQFLDECTYSGGRVKVGELFETYERFCHDQGERPVSKRALGDGIIKRRPNVESGRSGNARFYDGLSLDPVLRG